GSRITRRRLFMLSLGGAAGALGVALATPLVSLGPVFRIAPFFGTPWRRGRRLVDVDGRPWKASDIEEDDFYTAFAEGADKEELGSSVVLVRLPTDRFHLPPELAHYPADGIVAYSKICTHAGCAISLYRAPLFQAGARLPVPLVDFRRQHRWQGGGRAGRAPPADAAARDGVAGPAARSRELG